MSLEGVWGEGGLQYTLPDQNKFQEKIHFFGKTAIFEKLFEKKFGISRNFYKYEFETFWNLSKILTNLN